MNTLEQLFQQLQQQQKYQHLQEKAEAIYRFKPFIESFFSLHKLTEYARPILGVFSVVTGLGYLLDKAQIILPFYVAAVLSLLILIVIEISKNILSAISFRLLLKESKSFTGYFLAGLLLLMIAASVFFSVEGAAVIYQSLDKEKEITTSIFHLKKENLEADYNRQIEEEKSELAAYKKQVSYKGKINIHNATNRAVIASHNARIDVLLKEKSAALGKLENEATTTLESVKASHQFNTTFWMVASGAVEAMILLCLWFSAYYPYKIHQEKQLIKWTLPSVNLQSQELQRLMQVLSWQTTNTVAVPTIENQHANRVSEPKIGFKTTESQYKDAKTCVSENTAGVPKDKNSYTAGVPTSSTVRVQDKDGNFYNGYLITCKYCHTATVMKSPQAKYCCEKHRWKDHRVRGEASMQIPFT